MRTARTLLFSLSASAGLMVASALAVAPAYAATYSTLYQFTGENDGAYPQAGVAYDEKGNLYGSAVYGGATCTGYIYGCGTLYKISPSGQETVLVTFTGLLNGASPDAPPTLIDHKLYGSAIFGGAYQDGVLFSVRTDGTKFKLLHTFNGMDGQGPAVALVPGPAGVFYGTTLWGGPQPKNPKLSAAGVLFELMPDGTYIRLHDFNGRADGGKPSALIIDSSGTLYGSTENGTPCPAGGEFDGCGVVFSYVPSTGTFTVLYQFAQAGASPMLGSIGADGTLYGATRGGGANGWGSLFELVPAGGTYSLTTLYSFAYDGGPGSQPSAGPILSPHGALIGTTTQNGTLYKFKNNKMKALYTFPANSNLVPPTLDRNGTIYGAGGEAGIEPCETSIVSFQYGCGFVYSFVQ